MTTLTTDTLTLGTLTEGTVFTFTKDLGFMGAYMAFRRPGVHFVVGRLSESGYTFSAYNTATQRWEDMMAENWIFESTRVIGHLRPDHVTRVEQFSDGSWDASCRCGWEALGYEDQGTAEVIGREHRRSPEE